MHREDGKLIGELAGRPAALITFLEGMWMRRPTAAHCREVGKALAGTASRRRGFSAGAAKCAGRSMAGASSGTARAIAPTRSSRVLRPRSTPISPSSSGDWPESLPAGVIHADLFPDNVFFLGDKLSGLIDFYFACNDLYAYDVATCLNAWCFEKDHAFNLTKGTALLAGYQSVRPLSERREARRCRCWRAARRCASC